MTDSPRAETDKQIFVSYARKDRDKVIALYEDLQRLGFRLWRDLHEIRGGEKFWEEIKQAIDSSETVVLCMSPAALASKYVRAEWLYARQIGRRVIPVVIEDIDFDALPRWMGSVDWKDFREGTPERDLIWANFIRTLNTPYTPQKVPFMVETPPFDFIDRPDITEPVITTLENPAHRLIALKGAGGYGKTTLARVICHDERVRTAYDDGTLWVTLGEAVSEEDRIAKLLDLVVELRGERPPVQTLEAAKNELRTAIGDRHLLLVVDDAWRRPDLESFLVDAPNAAVLVTTRVRTALPDKTLIHDIDAMQPDQATALLSFGLPDDQVAHQQKSLDALARRLGEWALMLKLTNGALKTRMTDGDTLAGALTFVERSLTKRGLSKSFANTEQTRNATADASLGVSLDLLKPDERPLYDRLAIFPEDVDIPLAMLEILWEYDDFDTEDFARKLFDVSLLLRFELTDRIIRLHDIVRTHLRETEASLLPGLNAAFLDRMQTRYKITHWRDLPRDAPYLWQHLATHLIDARRADTLRDLLFDFGWLYAKLNATDPAALLADAVIAKDAFKDDRELRLIESALWLSQNALSEDKKQLANQIRGRLWIYKDNLDEYPNITALWNAVPDIPGTLALLPTQQFPPMIQAGGPFVRSLEGHEETVYGAVELKDGRLLSWSEDTALRLWTPDGTPLVELVGHTEGVVGAIELKDGRLLSWSDDATLRIWSFDGTPLAELTGHTETIKGAIELENGRLLSWAYDGMVRLWNTDGILINEEEDPVRAFMGKLELRDGRVLIWSDDTTLMLWNADHTLLGEFEGHNDVVGIIELKDSRWLSWSENNVLKIWTSDGILLRELVGHTDDVVGAIELKDGRLLSWSNDNSLKIWSADGTLLRELVDHIDDVVGAIELKDGRLLSWSDDNTLCLWTAYGIREQLLEGHTDPVFGACQLKEGKLLSWSYDMTLRLWTTESTGLSLETVHSEWGTGLNQLRDGHILSWSSGGKMCLWRSDGKLLKRLNAHIQRINGTIELRDGRMLTWSDDGSLSLCIWTSDGVWLEKLAGHKDRVMKAVELQDGRLLSWSVSSLCLWSSEGTLLGKLEINYSAIEEKFEAQGLDEWLHNRDIDPKEIASHNLEKQNIEVHFDEYESILHYTLNSKTTALFIGDQYFEDELFMPRQSSVITVADADGRVIFLKVVPPEE